MDVIESLISDLNAETSELVSDIGPLTRERWETLTPAPGWTIGDHVTHLLVVEGRAYLAAADANAFVDMRSVDLAEPGRLDRAVIDRRAMPPVEAVSALLSEREKLVKQLRILPPGTRIPWYGPDMAVASMLTARLMETWAHGQDIRDTLGLAPSASDRLRHICRIGVATRQFSYLVNNRQAPDTPIAVALSAPDGDSWFFGDDEAQDNVSGSALDFCLVVTRRRHLADTALVAFGDKASEWLTIAQAYAGAPGEGRQPGQHLRNHNGAANEFDIRRPHL